MTIGTLLHIYLRCCNIVVTEIMKQTIHKHIYTLDDITYKSNTN